MRHSWRGHEVLHFSFSDSVTRYLVANATLYVYVRGAERGPRPIVHIEVFKVYKDPSRHESPGTARVASRRVQQPMGRGDWVRVDVSEMVSEWFKSSRDNFGFVVNGTANGRRVVVTTDATAESSGKVSMPALPTFHH